ncbi:MAG: OmpA family protein, partial [Bacteroidia bacterium]|nr:OmpA family protein [Bacteroidia bacterium]
SIRHKVFFETGSSTLSPTAITFIDSVGTRLKRYSRYKIYLHGHTDDIGSPETNAILANKRLESVLVRLRQIGIDSSKVLGKSYGEENPISPNTTDQNRSQNRRVDISVVRYDKDTLIVYDACTEFFVPKGAFFPLLNEDIDFGPLLVTNDAQFAKSGLPSTDVNGKMLYSVGMIRFNTLLSGKPARQNSKRSIELRICNKNNLDKAIVNCLVTEKDGKQYWQTISPEKKVENDKLIIKITGDCKTFNFTTDMAIKTLDLCESPFILSNLPAQQPGNITTDNFIFDRGTSASTKPILFKELQNTCERIQRSVFENMGTESYIEKGRFIEIMAGKGESEESFSNAKIYFVQKRSKSLPSFYEMNKETSTWDILSPDLQIVHKGTSCIIYSFPVRTTGIYVLVDSLTPFEQNVTIKTKKYKPETMYIYYKPVAKRGKALGNGPKDEHFFKFPYATTLPVIGENKNNTLLVADTDNKEAMKLSKTKITDLRYKRRKHLYLVKKKQFSVSTDTDKDLGKLCKAKRRN